MKKIKASKLTLKVETLRGLQNRELAGVGVVGAGMNNTVSCRSCQVGCSNSCMTCNCYTMGDSCGPISECCGSANCA